MGQDDRDALGFTGFTAEEWALLRVLCEIWALLELLLERASTRGEEGRSEEERREEEEQALAALVSLARPGDLPPDTRTASTPHERHFLATLRLLSALAPPDRPGHLEPAVPESAESRSAAIPRRAGRPATPREPQLTTEDPAAPPSAFDALLTLASGVVQVLMGFHALGGIAAMLHGACRLASPESPLTDITSTVRKVVTPDITVIQESVKMIAPLPENERSGVRDTLCLTAYEAIGPETGALKHQLFAPRKAEPRSALRSTRPGARRVTVKALKPAEQGDPKEPAAASPTCPSQDSSSQWHSPRNLRHQPASDSLRTRGPELGF